MAVDHSVMWAKRFLIFRNELLMLWLIVFQSAASPSPSNVALKKATSSSRRSRQSSSSRVVVNGDRSDSFTVFSSRRFCTRCFLSTKKNNPWWRVDLGKQFFITNINIYTGSATHTIGPFEMLSKEISGKLSPAVYYDQWNVIHRVSDRVSTYKYPLPTAVYVQHVAIMGRNSPRSEYEQSLVLTEVEVYGFASAEFKPTNLQISSVTTDCVSFSWDSPYRSIGASYQYRCDSTAWSALTSNTVAEVCGLSPTLSTECGVRVKDKAVTTVSTQLQCSGQKLTSAMVCQNKTSYLIPGETTAEVMLSPEHVGFFPIGTHKFFKTYQTEVCTYYVNIKMSPVVRRLVFSASYDISCRLAVQNAYNRESVRESQLTQRDNLQLICGTDCDMSTWVTPFYECRNNNLTAYWPTDKLYSVATKQLPEDMEAVLRERLVGNQISYSNLHIQARASSDPILEATQDTEGRRIHLLLVSSCTDESLSYDPDNDICS